MTITPHITKLTNGLRVVLVPMHDTEIVSVHVVFRVGSRYEDRANSGVAHFLEHMAFKGTTKRPSPFLISQEIDAVGGAYNASTSKELTRYYMSVPANHQGLAYDLIADILTNSLFDEAEFEQEKGPICEEIKMYYDNPSDLRDLRLSLLTYGDTPLGWDEGGTIESVQAMKRQDIVDFYRTHYTPDNTIVVVAGKIDPDQVLATITPLFEAIPAAPHAPCVPYTNSQDSPRIELVSRPIEQCNISVLFRSFGLDAPLEKLYVRRLLTDILGGYMSSQLFMEVRERRGLAYSIYAHASAYADTGSLIIGAGVARDKLPETLQVISSILKKAKESGFSEEEINRAKENNIGSLYMSHEQSFQIASSVGTDLAHFGRHIPLDEKIALIRAVTNKQLMALAEEIFQMQHVNFVSVGPHEGDNPDDILASINV